MTEAVAGLKVVKENEAAPKAQPIFSRCKHNEIIHDDGRPAHLKHDCAYTDRRNQCIPAAEAEAYAAAGKRHAGAASGPASFEVIRAYENWAQAWNRAFHAAMNRISNEQEMELTRMKREVE